MFNMWKIPLKNSSKDNKNSRKSRSLIQMKCVIKHRWRRYRRFGDRFRFLLQIPKVPDGLHSGSRVAILIGSDLFNKLHDLTVELLRRTGIDEINPNGIISGN